MRLLISILFSITSLLPFSVAAQHNHHDHDGHTHDHHENDEDSSEPDINLDLRLLTNQQLEVGIQTSGLHLNLDWGDVYLTIFGGLGIVREGQLTTGLTFTEAIEFGWQPSETFETYLSGTYHVGPFEDTSANAGILETGLTIQPLPTIRLSLTGGIRGLAIKVNPGITEERQADEEENHHTFLIPALHGGHPEHAEEGPAEWFISAEMRINLWHGP